MGMDGCPQDLPGVTKLVDIYIAESGGSTNFRIIFGNEHTVLAFNQTK